MTDLSAVMNPECEYTLNYVSDQHLRLFNHTDLVPANSCFIIKELDYFNLNDNRLFFTKVEYRKIFEKWYSEYLEYISKHTPIDHYNTIGSFNSSDNDNIYLLLPYNSSVSVLYLVRQFNIQKEWIWIISNCEKAVYKINSHWGFVSDDDAALYVLNHGNNGD